VIPVVDPEDCPFYCDSCELAAELDRDAERYPVPGALWRPNEKPVEGQIQLVERCDECQRYASDEDACRAVAAATGHQAVFLEDRAWNVGEKDRGKGYGCYGVINPSVPLRKQCVRLTFEVVTTDVWTDEAIEQISNEFSSIYGGNLNIASACLISTVVEDVDDEEDADDPPSFDEDDDEEYEDDES
jgi:hypothetical protein